MKKLQVIFYSVIVVFAASCKSDDGLNDTDHKASFIKVYGTLSKGVDFKQTSDGGFILLGTTQGAASEDIYLKKVNSFGNDEWSKTYAGPINGANTEAADIEIIEDGLYAILATTSNTMTRLDVDDLSGDTIEIEDVVRSTYFVVADYIGNEIYSQSYFQDRTFQFVANEQAYGMAIGTNGRFGLVGERVVRSGLSIGVLRVLEPDYTQIDEIEGNLTQTPPGLNVGFRDIIGTTAGDVVVVGYTDQPGGANVTGNNLMYSPLVIRDTSRGFEGFFSLGGPGDDLGHTIIENSAGNVLMGGFQTTGSEKDMLIYEYQNVTSETPTEMWSFLGSSIGLGEEECFGLVEVDGGYVAVGYTEDAENNRQFHVVKISSDGSSVIWEKDYGFVSLDEGKKVIATQDGGIAVFGTSSDERGNPVMTLIKLDASGNLN